MRLERGRCSSSLICLLETVHLQCRNVILLLEDGTHSVRRMENGGTTDLLPR